MTNNNNIRHHRRGKPGNYVDPVGVIARGIIATDALGHADMKDFVRVGVEALALEWTPELDDKMEDIANVLFEDCGEKYASEQQMAAFIYARLTS